MKQILKTKISPMFLVIVFALSAASCATPQAQPPLPEPAAEKFSHPLPFDSAMRLLANAALEQIRQEVHAGETVWVVMEPFYHRETQEVPNVARAIEKHFMEAVAEQNPEVRLVRLNLKSLKQAAFLLEGNIGLATSGGSGKGNADRPYQVSARLIDLKERKAMPQLCAWISDPDLDSGPIALYRDSPLFFNQWRKGQPSETSLFLNDPDADQYLDHLRVRALMAEAQTAYDAGNFEQALALFRRAESTDKKNILPVHSGIYAASLKMGDMKAAEAAFGEIVRLSVERYDIITVKFLFEVNSKEFFGREKQQKIYEMWLRGIGDYFHRTKRSLEIVGHSSPTGPESWNEALSLQRAKAVQALLKKSFPEVKFRSRAIGRGFKENIIGTGSDDARDLLDRRVEIIPVPCNVEG